MNNSSFFAFCMCRMLANSCKICCNKGVKTGK
nr:MAG TPA: Membrane-proximal domain, switch, for ADAM17 [Bacteriophage sp.]